MSPSVAVPPEDRLAMFGASYFPITVPMYHEMIDSGIIGPDDQVELLEGILVKKMAKNGPHIFASETLRDLLQPMLPAGWHINSQNPVTTTDSEPEPDLAVIRGSRRDYINRKPQALDTSLIVEIADSTLQRDRAKRAIYARAGFPLYWLINIPDRQIEMYRNPNAVVDQAGYASLVIYSEKDEVPVELDGQEIGKIKVFELIGPAE